MNLPFGSLVRVHFGVSVAAVAARTGGAQIEAGDYGILICQVDALAANLYGIRMSNSSILNTGLVGVVPSVVSVSSSEHTLTSTILQGYINPGVPAVSPDFMPTGNFHGAPIFVPPGFFIAILPVANNTLASYSLAFDEYLEEPGT